MKLPTTFKSAAAKSAALRDDVTLQPHQQRIADLAAADPLRLLLVHSLGSGKSLSGIAAAEAQKQPYTAIVPAALRENYKKEIRKFTDEKTPSDVVSYTAVAQGKPLPRDHTLILDECLPAGTPVDGRPIEQYVPGDAVWSVNHATGCRERRRVARTACRPTDDIWLVELADGGHLACTGEHPVYTQRGYVPARELVCGDFFVRVPVDHIECAHATTSPNKLCNVRQRVLHHTLPVRRLAETLLGGVPEGGVGGGHAQGVCDTQGDDSHAHADRQSDAAGSNARAGVGDAQTPGAQAAHPGRQRAGADPAGAGAGCRAGVGDECRRDDRAAAQQGGPGHALQDRRGQPGTEGGCGNRRCLAQVVTGACGGRQEGFVPDLVRVDRVTVYQRGSGSEFDRLCPGGVVYDIEVEHNHNFFAHGYLVHNSHRLRNPESAQSQAVAAAARKARQLILLSGSPVVNRPGDLAVPTSLLTGKNFSPQQFEDRFMDVRKKYPSTLRWLLDWPTGSEYAVKNEKELRQLLRGKVDWFEPPAPSVPTESEDIPVEMSPEQLDLYHTMWDKIPWHVKWRLQNNYAMTEKELHKTLAFITGPRQAGLSVYPYMKDRDPYRAYEQSAKLKAAVGKLQETFKDPRAKALVFANYIDAGLTPYSAALSKLNIPHGVFHGGISDKERKKIVDDYNADRIRVALIGPSGTEGLSFRGTQLVQLLDPYWNPVRPRQAVGRGVRYDSHFGLPEELQKVKVQRFLSRLPPGTWNRLLSGVGFARREPLPATDDHLTALSKKKEAINQAFMALLKDIGSQREAAPPRPEAASRVEPPSPRPLDQLIRAKKESDRRNYRAKHQILADLLRRSPDDFVIDSEQNGIVGLTHRPTNFRIHAPRVVLPQPERLQRKG